MDNKFKKRYNYDFLMKMSTIRGTGRSYSQIKGVQPNDVVITETSMSGRTNFPKNKTITPNRVVEYCKGMRNLNFVYDHVFVDCLMRELLNAYERIDFYEWKDSV